MWKMAWNLESTDDFQLENSESKGDGINIKFNRRNKKEEESKTVWKGLAWLHK